MNKIYALFCLLFAKPHKKYYVTQPSGRYLGIVVTTPEVFGWLPYSHYATTFASVDVFLQSNEFKWLEDNKEEYFLELEETYEYPVTISRTY